MEPNDNHWLRIRVRHSRKNYGNEIESKGVQFPGRGAPDEINGGGWFAVASESVLPRSATDLGLWQPCLNKLMHVKNLETDHL